MSDIRAIDSIIVGERFRRDMGDIDEVVAEIRADGHLINPITITPAGRLICGERRLKACQLLGWTEVPVRVLDVDERGCIRLEASENLTRKNFTPSEAVAVKRALEPEIRAAAKARQAMAGGSAPGKLPEALGRGESRDKVAIFTGYAARTLDKAEAVVAAAEAEPERFGPLLADMNRTGRVDGPHRRLTNMRQAELIRAEPPPFPTNGPYRVASIDVPWPYELRRDDPSHRGVHPYATMTIAEMQALPIPTLMAPDAIVWMWSTNHHLREAFGLLDGWGFESKTMLTWAKDRMGFGDWLRGQTEHCLMAVRGHPIVTLTNQTTLLPAPVTRHSEKPAAFYALVESLCPAPRYLDMFARQARPGWDAWGAEAPQEAATCG